MITESMNIIFKEIFKRMEHISLSEMNDIQLMNRIDTKYLMPFSSLPELLRRLEKDFRVQEVEGKKISKYRTMYFDTQDLKMYQMHHNQKMDRQKVRTRTYLDSGISFLEIKKKDNKGRTRKTRIPIPNEDFANFSGNAEAALFLEKKSLCSVEDLIPHILSTFERITLVNNNKSERITIDTNLCFINYRTDKKAHVPDLAIIELKQDGKIHSLLRDILADFRIFPGGISKYCLGTALTDPEVKSNRFKQKLRYIDKLTLNKNETN